MKGTHLADPKGPDPEGGRTVALCGVKVPTIDIVSRSPGCTWCSRLRDRDDENARMRRIERGMVR